MVAEWPRDLYKFLSTLMPSIVSVECKEVKQYTHALTFKSERYLKEKDFVLIKKVVKDWAKDRKIFLKSLDPLYDGFILTIRSNLKI